MRKGTEGGNDMLDDDQVPHSTTLSSNRAATLTLIGGTLLGLTVPASAQATNPLLPQNLSPWGMFLNADILVKAVMVGLAFASLVTWTIWLAKTIELRIATMLARRRL